MAEEAKAAKRPLGVGMCTATRPSCSPGRWSWAGGRISCPRCAPATTRFPTSRRATRPKKRPKLRAADRSLYLEKARESMKRQLAAMNAFFQTGRPGVRIWHQHPQGMPRRRHAGERSDDHPRFCGGLHPARCSCWGAARSAGPAFRARPATWPRWTTWCWRCSRTTRPR